MRRKEGEDKGGDWQAGEEMSRAERTLQQRALRQNRCRWAKRKLMWLFGRRVLGRGACLRSHWGDGEGKHKANQLTETFPVLVLSDDEEPKG